MSNLTRRGFIATAAAAASVRNLPKVVATKKGRVILTLVYDKSMGMMRAVERMVY